MDRDTRRLLLITLAVLAALAALVGPWWFREHTRPRLAEARIVLATSGDPVLREGPRTVGPEEEVTIAVALRLEWPRGRSQWLAPGAALELDGERVDHLDDDTWPEDDRTVRVFWFTVESRNLGGDLAPGETAERLAYRTYLAPELGRGLRAEGEGEPHNDDGFAPAPATLPIRAGTLRYYARAEVVRDPFAVRSEEVASTLPVDHLDDPAFPAVHRRAAAPEGVRSEAGELFNLPGFEPSVPADGAEAPGESFAERFAALVERRLVVSSRTFATVAATGSLRADGGSPVALGRLALADGVPVRSGRALAWGADIRAGDLLATREGHWAVLVADDGDGLLSAGDVAWHCYRRPPVAVPLASVYGETVLSVTLYRHGG